MPRCKNCKEKFDAKHFNQKYCFKSECVKVWVETAKVKNWKKEKKRLKDELETVQSLTGKSKELEERKETTKRRIRNRAKPYQKSTEVFQCFYKSQR
jgi:hypothetical protein